MTLNVPSGLCVDRGRYASDLRRIEMQRQNRIDQAITQRRPAVGMNARELDAALGSPTRKNYSASGSSETNQLIYERGARTWYVYTDEGGNVRSIDNSATIGAPTPRAPRQKDTLVQY